MKKSSVIKQITALGITICICGSLIGCGKEKSPVLLQDDIMQALTEENETAKAASEQKKAIKNLTGTVTMAGSTSMEKFANALAESFMIKYPGVTVTVEFTGSSTGIESVLAGRVDIGNSSRYLKDEEKSSGAVENIIALEGIAVITDASNTTASLSAEQLIGIYTGRIRNWSEVGGDDEAIVVVGREAGSGTREGFEELLGIKDMCAYANELDSAGTVMARVALTPGAIGYVSPDILDDTVLTISLDGTGPTEENIKAGNYLLCRPFIMVTKGEVSVQSEAVREMFAYLRSKEGRELVRAVGLIVPD